MEMIWLFYFSKAINYATLNTSVILLPNSFLGITITSKNYKGLLVNTKNANTFTGKQGKEEY